MSDTDERVNQLSKDLYDLMDQLKRSNTEIQRLLTIIVGDGMTQQGISHRLTTLERDAEVDKQTETIFRNELNLLTRMVYFLSVIVAAQAVVTLVQLFRG